MPEEHIEGWRKKGVQMISVGMDTDFLVQGDIGELQSLWNVYRKEADGK